MKPAEPISDRHADSIAAVIRSREHVVAQQAAGTSEQRRPNVILILADDMGYSDLGCFGSEIRTPTIDGLAKGGMRFSQAYNCARCCPSRAALLTGLYPHQSGVGHMVADMGVPGYQGYLNDRCVTITEVLRLAGYRTLMSGKWHVGGHFGSNPAQWIPGIPGYPTPRQRGFDHFYGTLAGAVSYFNPHVLLRDDTMIEPEGDSYYFTDAVADEAVKMLQQRAGEDQPFFLHLAFNAPHWPLHALPEDIARYVGRYRQGWDTLRTQRHEVLRDSGILSRKWAISPRDEKAPPWSDIADPDWEDLRMAVYAAQIDSMDQGIARVLAELRRQGVEDNTMVIFLSDNGGCAEFLMEDGMKGFQLHHTRDHQPMRIGNRRDWLPGGEDTYMSYDLPWANASNTPFRLFKHWAHEGGISTPMIVHWPGVIEPGRIVHEPCHFIDIMPTLLAAAGAPYPESYEGREILPPAGESLLPALRGDSWTRQQAIYWEHEGNKAVRLANFKLVARFPGPWELYDIAEDRTELHDLSSYYQDTTRKMEHAYDDFAARCGVLPWAERPWLGNRIR